MFPAVELDPAPLDGCKLTGKATSAECSSLPPPAAELKGKSPIMLEKSGGRPPAPKRLGVESDMMGVVKLLSAVTLETVGAAGRVVPSLCTGGDEAWKTVQL